MHQQRRLAFASMCNAAAMLASAGELRLPKRREEGDLTALGDLDQTIAPMPVKPICDIGRQV